MNNNASPISCILLQETWCDSSVDLSLFLLPSYNMVSKPVRISRHGGLAIYIHENYSFKQVEMIDNSSLFENLCVELKCKNANLDKYLVCNVYRPPMGVADNLTDFINTFHLWTNDIFNKSKKSYICGDFNINLLQIQTNDCYSQFYDNMMSVGFIPNITLPTRISETAATLIDNIFTNNIEKSHISGVLSTHFSDHQMIFTILKTNFRDSNNSKKYVEIELTSEENLEKFKAEITERNIYGVLDKNITHDPNINIEILTNAIIDAKNMHIPIKRRKFNKRKDKKEVWMTTRTRKPKK